MIAGNPSAWRARFRSVDTRLVERIVAVWPLCLKVLKGQPEEDTITINLIDALLKDEKARSIVYWIEYQYEPFGFDANGLAFSKGKIDMAVLLEQERKIYLAYECKRLNVRHKGSKKSLATAYVADGLMRFITEQYAEELHIGCMLGYVMDGHCGAAISSVQTAIQANKDVQLNGALETLDAVGKMERFSSPHLKRTNGTQIEIRHAFLPF
jgi:hypothetical protein